jgi:N-acetylmuramoyl-L-alanine amidase
MARQVLELYRSEAEKLPPLSRVLAGRHIVIDPGHGGLDPGAIVSVKDGNGNPVVITEDEYVYDIALRLGRLLIRHGASVSFTILAPDHHIRDGLDARQTFVHRKNEVYNDEAHNRSPGWRPVGTADGLDLRKDIASLMIAGTPRDERKDGTVFISIHADNSPDLPEGKAVLFDGADDEELERSRSLAEAMAPSLGSGSFIRGQSLKVLKDNPAGAAVLVEVRNIHYSRNAWALRSAELREQDAKMIADGLAAWAGNP